MTVILEPTRTNGVVLNANLRSHSNLIKSDTFGDIRTGDRVKVLDPENKHAGMIFEFVCFTTNIANGRQWVDLWGGLRRHEAWHAVAPDMIVKSGR